MYTICAGYYKQAVKYDGRACRRKSERREYVKVVLDVGCREFDACCKVADFARKFRSAGFAGYDFWYACKGKKGVFGFIGSVERDAKKGIAA